MKILIVGGGVAGPALARFLKDHAEITLIDKAPAWGNIGYAITLWGNGQKILKELNLDQKVLKEGYEIPWSAFEDKKGKILRAVNFDIFRAYGPTTAVTRASLQQALVYNLENFIKLKLNTTLSSVAQDISGVQVVFSDGSTDRFDLMVGADGIRSQVRELVFGKDFLKLYGWTLYVFWTPTEIAPPKGAIEFAAGGKMCLVYPMEDRGVVMLGIATKNEVLDKTKNSKELLLQMFSDFKYSVDHMIEAIEDPKLIFKDFMAYVDMKPWYKGRVVLIGDAKHGTSPITGMGASMALEDAYVLAEELKKVNTENISSALKRYSDRREKRVGKFIRASNFIEKWMMVKSPFFSIFRDLILKIIPVSYFTRPIEKVLKETI